MKIRWTILRVVFFINITICTISAAAQTVVKGVVRDGGTQEPMPLVSIYFLGGKGVTSNEDGSYRIETNNEKNTTLIFSYSGYKKAIKKIVPLTEQSLDVDLFIVDSLRTVTIKAKRGKYKNKNNPAVELIDKVIANKEKNK